MRTRRCEINRPKSCLNAPPQAPPAAASPGTATGQTNSTARSFPVKGGPDLSFNGGPYDAFVVKITSSPFAATLIAPKGTITDKTPTYQWNAVATAAKYFLKVKDGSGTEKIGRWYTAAQSGCAGGTGICAVTPGTALADGAGQWWIRTWNAVGYGPWSVPLAFEVLSP